MKNLTSGRFWLTVISGFGFAYTVYAKTLPPEAVATILTLVFTSYFNKKEDK